MTRFLVTVLAATVAVACAAETRDAPPAIAQRLDLADSVDHLDALAREPMVVVHPSGALFVTGYWDSPPPLWKSTDIGRTWTRVAVGATADGAAGNSDSDLAIAGDGTIYFITLVFDRTALKGASIHVAVSQDTGTTWRWSRLSRTPGDDRPWIEVGPDGAAHAIWNDGAGVRHATSRDRGATWIEQGRVHTEGGSSHLVVGRQGEVAVRIIPLSSAGNQYHAGADFVAVSSNQGETWRRSAGPGNLAFPPMWDTTVTPRQFRPGKQPRWVEPLAWDSTGALYAFYGKNRELWLARSTDRGATWREWKVAESDSTAYFPYLIGRGNGELAASWFSGHGDSLRITVARLWLAPTDTIPRIALSDPFQPESWVLPGFGAKGRDTAGEYIPLVFLPDGSLGAVAPLQNFGAKRLGFSWRRYVTATTPTVSLK